MLLHQILVLDAELAGHPDQSKQQELTDIYISELIEALGMEKLGKLEVYPATDLEYPGWSFIQPITTSHISGHYFEDKKGFSHIHVDAYSCKDFDWESVIELTHKLFELAAWSGTYIHRDTDPKKRRAWFLSGRGAEVEMMDELK